MRARRIDTLANRNRKPLPNHGAKWKKALAWAVAAWTLGMAPEAFAHPILDAAGAGVTISGTTDMSITSGEATNNLIKWVDFSIQNGEKVTFDANNYLNYVTGSARSDILGTLTGGGSIYIVNPNGILIGDGATVNVGNLHLSTKALTAEQLANYETATAALPLTAIGSGDVINLGTLKATSITVEGNNITFKNVANVNSGSAANVTLTANSAGEIHIGSAEGTTSGYTVNGATETDYKLVHNAAELQNMQNGLAGKYMLAGDIDMGGVGNFTPIGNSSNNFTGKFDGLNYKIMNLTINKPDTDYVGLFGYNRGTIENVGKVGGSIRGDNNVGGIVGRNDNGTVKNVYNTGTVNGTGWYVGGIVGGNWGTVENVYNTGTVSGTNTGTVSDTGWYVGGIAGNHQQQTVKNAYNTGTVSGTQNVGGIIGNGGSLYANTVTNVYNKGAVSGTRYVGGIVGNNQGTTITNVYNSGTVSGTDSGGIFGRATYPDRVTNAYTSNSKNAVTFDGFDFSENGEWRIYEGKTTPLLTAFLTRKDNITTTTYDGSADVGEVTYQPTTYSGVQAQNGYNYIKDASVVTPANLTVSFGDISKTYDGTTSATAGTATLNGIVNSDSGKVSLAEGVTATYDNKNAGTNKTVTYSNLALTGDKAKNYNLANAAKGKGTITAKEITATFANVSKTYDGGTSVTAGAGSSTGIVTGDTVTITGTANFTDKNVGTDKTVSYTGVSLGGADAGNYSIAATATGKGSIAAKLLTATFNAISKTYDGTTGVAAMGAGALDGKIDGDDVSVTAAEAAYADKNAGAKTVNYTGIALSGTDAANYTIANTATGNGTITAKEIAATFADISKIYDGTTTATAGAGTLTGVEAIDEGKVSVSGVAAYDTKNVGTGKTVNYTDVTLTGEEKDNYTIADNATGSGEITKANVTFTVEDYSREYDGTESTTGATLKTVGTIYDNDTVSGGTFTLDSRNAGTRTLSVSGVTIDDGNGGNNYNVTFQDGTGTITAAPLTVSTDAVTKEYDGTTSAAGTARVASGTLYGTDAISGGTFAFTDKNAGTGKAIAVSGVTVSDGNGGNNYNVTYQSGTGTITAVPLTISTDAVTKEYDGTTSAAGAAAKVASGTLYGADAISGGTFAFADKNAGTGKAITVSGVTINDGNGGNNYNVTYQNGTGTITRKALELVADAKTITEGEARPAFTGRVTGFVEGEGLESASDLAFAPANPAAAAAGIYKVTGRLKGAASGDYGMNYTFANAAANDTAFTIEARSILPQEIISNQIEASGAAQEYKGTVTALETTARAENQAALPQQEKFAGGTTANYVSHLTIENGGTNTPPNMDVAAAMSGEKAEQTAASSAGTKAAPAAEAIADRATADEEE